MKNSFKLISATSLIATSCILSTHYDANATTTRVQTTTTSTQTGASLKRGTSAPRLTSSLGSTIRNKMSSAWNSMKSCFSCFKINSSKTKTQPSFQEETVYAVFTKNPTPKATILKTNTESGATQSSNKITVKAQIEPKPKKTVSFNVDSSGNTLDSNTTRISNDKTVVSKLNVKITVNENNLPKFNVEENTNKLTSKPKTKF